MGGLRCERPRRDCAAEQRDELAAPHPAPRLKNTASWRAAYLSLALMTWTRRFSRAKGPDGFFSWLLP
jgi:hypothetical protein